MDTRSCYVNMRVRAGLLVMGLALIVMKVGGPHKALAQAKTRIAVTAFENKVKTPWWDPSWKIGEGLPRCSRLNC